MFQEPTDILSDTLPVDRSLFNVYDQFLVVHPSPITEESGYQAVYNVLGEMRGNK